MPEVFEILEVAHENIMSEIFCVIGFRTIAPADSINLLIILVIGVFKMVFLDFPPGGGGMPNSTQAHRTHLIPFFALRTATFQNVQEASWTPLGLWRLWGGMLESGIKCTNPGEPSGSENGAKRVRKGRVYRFGRRARRKSREPVMEEGEWP